MQRCRQAASRQHCFWIMPCVALQCICVHLQVASARAGSPHKPSLPQFAASKGISVPNDDQATPCARQGNIHAAAIMQEAQLTLAVAANSAQHNDFFLAALEAVNGVHLDYLISCKSDICTLLLRSAAIAANGDRMTAQGGRDGMHLHLSMINDAPQLRASDCQ